MICPVCESATKIIDSREVNKRVRRRRECLTCLSRFNTFEEIDFTSLTDHLKKDIDISKWDTDLTNSRRKLNSNQVEEIKIALRDKTENMSALARKYNVAVSTIFRIREGEIHSWITI